MEDERTTKIMQGFLEGTKLSATKINEFQPNSYDCYRIFKATLDYEYRSEIQSPQQEQLIRTSLNILEQSKLFRINEKIKYLLLPELTTKSFIHKGYKMSFDNLFFDLSLTINKCKIFGIVVSKLMKDSFFYEIYNIRDEIITEGVIIQIVYFSKENNCFVRTTTIMDINTGQKGIIPDLVPESISDEEKQVTEYVSSFLFNMLHFLNEPRVTIYIQDRNSKARAKRGLIPLPSELKTKIQIDLENYIEKIYFTGLSHSKLGFSFWVRGHWRSFNSPRFVNKQGQKMWILPHIRGEGLMPPQIFEVT